jgi:hypothetical protein
MVEAVAKTALKDAAKIALFDEQGTVFYSNFKAWTSYFKEASFIRAYATSNSSS